MVAFCQSAVKIFKKLLPRFPFLVGEVVLRNLQLKKEALDKFNLPVDVLEGELYVDEVATREEGWRKAWRNYVSGVGLVPKLVFAFPKS